MPKLEYFIVSDGVSVDQRSNRVSIFNILEEFRPNRFPAPILQAIATSSWNREPSDEAVDYQVQLRIHAPGEERYREFPTNLRMDKMRHRIIQQIVNLQVSQPGELKFEVLINGEHAATHTVTILQAE